MLHALSYFRALLLLSTPAQISLLSASQRCLKVDIFSRQRETNPLSPRRRRRQQPNPSLLVFYFFARAL
jgi:hypothetical protein